jgi:hypothetical protein
VNDRHWRHGGVEDAMHVTTAAVMLWDSSTDACHYDVFLE